MTMSKQYYVNITHRGETYTRERDPNLSFEELCDDVWTGQLEDFVSIIEVDLEAGAARDCEKDVALALSHRSFKDGEPYYDVVDLIEKHQYECFKNERPRARRVVWWKT
jgi:hypothetical protein